MLIPCTKSVYVSGKCPVSGNFAEVEAVYEKIQPPGYEFPVGRRVDTICDQTYRKCLQDCPIGNPVIDWDL